MKSLGTGFLALVGLVALVVVFGVVSYYGGIFSHKVQANYQKRVVTYQVQEKVRTAAFAQGAYEHFFNLCAQVQTDEASLDAQNQELAQTTNPDDQSTIRTNIAGLIANRADNINQYNADAAEYTRGQFLASNLPSSLDNTTYTKGTKTLCVR